METTTIKDPSFRAFMRKAFGRAAQREVQAAVSAEKTRVQQAAELRNPDGPVRRGPASLADILGTRR